MPPAGSCPKGVPQHSVLMLVSIWAAYAGLRLAKVSVDSRYLRGGGERKSGAGGGLAEVVVIQKVMVVVVERSRR